MVSLTLLVVMHYWGFIGHMFILPLCVCVTAASMNNLNDPPRWNIEPDARGRGAGAGAGDGNQWNYALLVPMLGLAAFRKSVHIFLYECVKQ